MPTYKNESEHTTYKVLGISGEVIKLKPGYSAETQKTYDISDLTKTADTPYYNPLLSTTHVLSSGTEVDIASLTKTIEVLNTSDRLVSMHLDSASNDPAISVIPTSNKSLSIENQQASKVVFTFSGESFSSGEVLFNQYME